MKKVTINYHFKNKDRDERYSVEGTYSEGETGFILTFTDGSDCKHKISYINDVLSIVFKNEDETYISKYEYIPKELTFGHISLFGMNSTQKIYTDSVFVNNDTIVAKYRFDESDDFCNLHITIK